LPPIVLIPQLPQLVNKNKNKMYFNLLMFFYYIIPIMASLNAAGISNLRYLQAKHFLFIFIHQESDKNE